MSVKEVMSFDERLEKHLDKAMTLTEKERWTMYQLLNADIVEGIEEGTERKICGLLIP